eukprot:TRINITY_DN28344_c0_g1_i1.p1 TRINITY_DN28344_c0_g1~~TRINITY_DN28344_c0_g1_i1.p1  ORF type:complete len:275 (+),score=58.66 TRINITY_DN28344_c0_g1_i1:33-857(+)
MKETGKEARDPAMPWLSFSANKSSSTKNYERRKSSKMMLEGFREVELQFSSLLNCQNASSSVCPEEHDKRTSSENERFHGHLTRMWQMMPSPSRPSLCNHQGDRSLTETLANVLTSIPFICLGIQAPRRKAKQILYANSLVGVGVASSMYHMSRGESRKLWRWADYAMIAMASVSLSTAVRQNPGALAAASAAVLPFQPFLVSAVHTGMTEVIYAQRRALDPELRRAHGLHAAATAVGVALFVADDLFPNTPFIHAAWHLGAAAAVATYNKLLG